MYALLEPLELLPEKT